MQNYQVYSSAQIYTDNALKLWPVSLYCPLYIYLMHPAFPLRDAWLLYTSCLGLFTKNKLRLPVGICQFPSCWPCTLPNKSLSILDWCPFQTLPPRALFGGGVGKKNKMCGGGASAKKIKCMGGGPWNFPVRPPLRISNGIALTESGYSTWHGPMFTRLPWKCMRQLIRLIETLWEGSFRSISDTTTSPVLFTELWKEVLISLTTLTRTDNLFACCHGNLNKAVSSFILNTLSKLSKCISEVVGWETSWQLHKL